MLFVRDTSETERENKVIFQASAKKQKASTATFISSKIAFKMQCTKEKNKGYFTLVERTIHKEDRAVINPL